MNSIKQVDALIVELKNKIASGVVNPSEAGWILCLACRSWPYVYSAWGAECTPTQRRYRYNLCPSHATIKSKCQVLRDSNPKPNCTGCQWFPDGERTRCFDCRGFTNWILKTLCDFNLYGDTVSTQWNHAENWCVKGQFGVDPIPQNVLVNVFIKKNGKWTHTGFYFSGSTCECSNGVQYYEKMQSNRWTHWAIAKCFASGYKLPEKPVKEQVTVSKKTIRKGNYGDLVKQLQTRLKELGYDLGVCGVDGDFGIATEKAVKAFQKDHGLVQDGVVGPKTWEALDKTDTAVVYYKVIIAHLTEAQADDIVHSYPSAVKERE